EVGERAHRAAVVRAEGRACVGRVGAALAVRPRAARAAHHLPGRAELGSREERRGVAHEASADLARHAVAALVDLAVAVVVATARRAVAELLVAAADVARGRRTASAHAGSTVAVAARATCSRARARARA